MDETPDVSSCGWSLSNIKPLYLVLLHPSPLKVQQTFENPQMEILEFKDLHQKTPQRAIFEGLQWLQHHDLMKFLSKYKNVFKRRALEDLQVVNFV